MTNPMATADMTAIDDMVSIADHTPRERQDLEMPNHEPNQDYSARNKQEYPESEMDDWDWDELEAPPFKGTTTSIQGNRCSLWRDVNGMGSGRCRRV